MAQAKKGDNVQIHYTGTLDNGTQFDSSEGREPLAFELGSGQVISGFDSAVAGMEVDETKTVKIPAAEAYGDVREELVIKVPKSDFPEHIKPEVDQQLQLMGPNNQPIRVKVTEVGEGDVTLDANHELAGEDLTFEIKLVAIDD